MPKSCQIFCYVSLYVVLSSPVGSRYYSFEIKIVLSRNLFFNFWKKKTFSWVIVLISIFLKIWLLIWRLESQKETNLDFFGYKQCRGMDAHKIFLQKIFWSQLIANLKMNKFNTMYFCKRAIIIYFKML